MIAVNGAPNALVAPGSTIRALLDVLGVEAEARGIAVAVDAEVVPRPQWPAFVIPDGAQVEVLTAVQGG
jgi:sulfur carrier protein